MIEITRGNLLEADVEALVNTVNLEGVMGKGIALQFARAFPEIVPPYEAACRSKEIAPGKVQVIERPGLVNPHYIINFPTKRHWRGKSRLADIDAGLNDLVAQVRARGIKSIAVPPLGCGFGGLDWSEVRPRIEAALARVSDVRVLLFEPAGAPDPAKQPVRTPRPALTAARARVIEVLAAYLSLGYELTLLEVQKLLYMLQAAGEPLKLRYVKHLYGPYADNLRQVLARFEGHYTQGYGEGRDQPETPIEVLPGAAEAASQFLAAARGDGEDERLARVVRLIEGYESPYGMELLATVHWVAANDEPPARTLDEAIERIHAWNERKRQLMPRDHIAQAWARLHDQGWLPAIRVTHADPAVGAAEAATGDAGEADSSTGATTPSASTSSDETTRRRDYSDLTKEDLIRILQRRDAERQYGLVWERDELEADRALNNDFVALDLVPELSHGDAPWRNLIIEGDNYDALRHLRMTHKGRIRCIYIDPPYNTGNKDFVYNDRYVDNTHRYRHSLWIEFMYRRLTLARELLADDGAIFVSIDDNEVHNLGLLMARVFGEASHVATCVWQKRYSRENRESIGDAHEYIFVYSREPAVFKRRRGLLPLGSKQTRRFRNPDNDPRGPWQSVSLLAQGYRPNQMYKITAPNGRSHEPPDGNCWKLVEPEYEKLLAEERVYFGKDGNGVPRRKDFPGHGLVPWTWWPHEEVGHTDEAKKEIQSIFGTQTAFDTPKPVRLMDRVLRIAARPGDTVLDFFAGSGTMAHAVAKLNAEDGGDRRFIMVGSTEATGEQPARNVCRDICAERVRRVLGGYTNAEGEAIAGLGGGFAYLRTQRIPPHRVSRRLAHAQVWHALQLLHAFDLMPEDGAPLLARERSGTALAYLPEFGEAGEALLREWLARVPANEAIVYSWAPDRLAALARGASWRPIPASLRVLFGA
jgi:adenine-specific DNA-methyltransferase